MMTYSRRHQRAQASPPNPTMSPFAAPTLYHAAFPRRWLRPSLRTSFHCQRQKHSAARTAPRSGRTALFRNDPEYQLQPSTSELSHAISTLTKAYDRAHSAPVQDQASRMAHYDHFRFHQQLILCRRSAVGLVAAAAAALRVQPSCFGLGRPLLTTVMCGAARTTSEAVAIVASSKSQLSDL